MAAEIYYSPFIFIPVLCNAARIASVTHLNRFGTFWVRGCCNFGAAVKQADLLLAGVLMSF
jgi:hypothetical protein